MSSVVYEVGDSQSGSVSTSGESGDVFEYTRKFVVGPVDDGILDAYRDVQNYAPRWFQSPIGVVFTRKKLDLRNIGAKYYEAVAEYSTIVPSKEEEDNDDPVFPLGISWDTTGRTEHITQALGTTVTPADGPDIWDAINVSGDQVAGLDVVRPSLRYSETWLVPAALAVSGEFVSAVYRLTGTTNEQAFRYFDAGEVLFMGARTQWNGGDPFVSVTFDFECRPNEDSVYVNGITGVEKKGWQYLWIWYEPKANDNKLVRLPEYVFVQDVYKEEDWSDLLIPGIAPSQARPGLAGQNPAEGAAAFLNG